MGFFDGEWSITDMTNPQHPTFSTPTIAPKTKPVQTTPEVDSGFDVNAGREDLQERHLLVLLIL